jgi:hypothetical protein
LDQHAVHERVRYFFFANLFKQKVLGHFDPEMLALLKQFVSVNFRYAVNGYKKRQFLTVVDKK